MELSFYLLSFKIAVVAYIYSEVLTEAGMILNWFFHLIGKLPEWLFKPLIGCFKCVAGQFALWTFLVQKFENYSNIKTIFELTELVGNHIFFISITIFIAWLINKVYTK